MSYSYSATSALHKINRSWWYHTLCYLGIAGLLIGILYYGAITGKIFSKNAVEPVVDGPVPGLILGLLFLLATLPTYSKILFRRFSLRPYFDDSGSSIVWSDEQRYRTNGFLFVIKAIFFLPASVFIAPLVPIAVCPYKAKEISERYGVRSFNYKLAITICWILVVGAFVGAVILLISKKGFPGSTNY